MDPSSVVFVRVMIRDSWLLLIVCSHLVLPMTTMPCRLGYPVCRLSWPPWYCGWISMHLPEHHHHLLTALTNARHTGPPHRWVKSVHREECSDSTPRPLRRRHLLHPQRRSQSFGIVSTPLIDRSYATIDSSVPHRGYNEILSSVVLERADWRSVPMELGPCSRRWICWSARWICWSADTIHPHEG